MTAAEQALAKLADRIGTEINFLADQGEDLIEQAREDEALIREAVAELARLSRERDEARRWAGLWRAKARVYFTALLKARAAGGGGHGMSTAADPSLSAHDQKLFEGWGFVLPCGCVDAMKKLGDGRAVWTTIEFCEAHRGLSPRIVCLCGSTRFKAEIETANQEQTLLGRIVLAPGVFGREATDIGKPADALLVDADLKRRLDELHFRKIDLADEVLVVAPGGYVGESTRREINYAERTGKPVIFRD